VAVLAAVSTAYADAPSAEDLASARVLGTEGTRLADAGNCAAAVPKLEAAEKLFHAPTTLDRLGECQIAIGKLVAGTESLNRVVRETLAPGAPAAFVAAQKRAQQALGAAMPRIGSLRIHVDGVPADKATVTVDGAPVPSALFDTSRPTDPGAHEVKATAPGYLVVTATATVKDGGEASIALKLDPDPAASAPPPPPPPASPAPVGTVAVAPAAPATAPTAPPAPGPPPEAPPPQGGGHGAAVGALVVGGVGLTVGTVFGILALGTKSTLDSACVAGKQACPASSQSDISSLSTKATVSTIGFGVGLVGVAVGLVLLAVSHESGAPPPGVQASLVSPPPVRVTPWIGLGTAGVGGTFQ
jgi:hypothetical protein